MNKRSIYICIIVLILIILAFSIRGLVNKNKSPESKNNEPAKTSQSDVANPQPQTNETVVPKLALPLDNITNRVTKKPFGIYITAKNSPVQPERFSGYHVGTDFETFPEELNSDIPFYAICTGQILQKRTASGYGGLLVQECKIDNHRVTVIYGHVSLKSISKKINEMLSAGEKIGLLGQPPSETDGERKHLHLGIHQGGGSSIAGYVQKESDLSAWMDYQQIK